MSFRDVPRASKAGQAGRSGDTALGISTEEQWDSPSDGEDCQFVEGKSTFLQEINFFSDTQRYKAGMCAQKMFHDL